MTENRPHVLSLTLIVGLCLAAIPASAAVYEPTEAESIRDDAISKTVAWRPKSAETILKNAETIDETQPFKTAEAFLMVAYGINNEQELVDRGLAILENQAAKQTDDTVSAYYLGEALAWIDKPLQAKDAWGDARDRAQAMTKKYPRYAPAHFYLGAAQLRLKKYEDARKSLKRAQKLDFNPPMVNFQLGLVYLFEEKWKPAKDAFDAVHEVDPRYAHLYFYRGIASEKLGRKADLINDMNQFVKLAPNSPEAEKARAILSAVR